MYEKEEITKQNYLNIILNILLLMLTPIYFLFNKTITFDFNSFFFLVFEIEQKFIKFLSNSWRDQNQLTRFT